jgi:hypothetical protein
MSKNPNNIRNPIALLMLVLLTLFFLNCSRDDTINNPAGKDADHQSQSSDVYEPNDVRSQAYEFISLPVQQIEGLLADRNDIDWFKIPVTDKDTCEIKLQFDLVKMTENFAIDGCFYNETEVPKGCFKLYKGPDSNAKTTFGWQCTPGDYYLYVKVDTNYAKEAGKYCFDITM